MPRLNTSGTPIVNYKGGKGLQEGSKGRSWPSDHHRCLAEETEECYSASSDDGDETGFN